MGPSGCEQTPHHHTPTEIIAFQRAQDDLHVVESVKAGIARDLPSRRSYKVEISRKTNTCVWYYFLSLHISGPTRGCPYITHLSVSVSSSLSLSLQTFIPLWATLFIIICSNTYTYLCCGLSYFLVTVPPLFIYACVQLHLCPFPLLFSIWMSLSLYSYPGTFV
jgi:hypothetical protein